MLTGAEVVGVAQGPEATLKRIAATGADVVVVGLLVAGESGLNLVARCARVSALRRYRAHRCVGCCISPRPFVSRSRLLFRHGG